MVGELKIPFVILPLANVDDTQHADDENLPVGNDLTGRTSCRTLLTESFPT